MDRFQPQARINRDRKGCTQRLLCCLTMWLAKKPIHYSGCHGFFFAMLELCELCHLVKKKEMLSLASFPILLAVQVCTSGRIAVERHRKLGRSKKFSTRHQFTRLDAYIPYQFLGCTGFIAYSFVPSCLASKFNAPPANMKPA